MLNITYKIKPITYYQTTELIDYKIVIITTSIIPTLYSFYKYQNFYTSLYLNTLIKRSLFLLILLLLV